MDFRIIVLAVLIMFSCLSAEVIPALQVGTIENWNLLSGQEIWFYVKATESGILTVETVGNLHTKLGHFNKNRTFIKENYGENNASLSLFATEGETYLFRLTGVDDYESGAFRIFAISSPMPLVTDLQIGDIKVGNTLGWYRFLATQDGILTVETDTRIQVFSENLVLLAEDYGSEVEFFVIQGKTYYFVLHHDDNEYQVSITDIRDLPSIMPLSHRAQGFISPGKEDWYSIRTPEGEEVIVKKAIRSYTITSAGGDLTVETTGNTNTRLYAYNELFELLAIDDDSGQGQNARIEFTIRPSQTYYFKVVSGLNSSGEYVITEKQTGFE